MGEDVEWAGGSASEGGRCVCLGIDGAVEWDILEIAKEVETRCW